MSSNSDAAITIHDLAKTYRSGILRRNRIQALKGINLQIERGSIFGLLGPNGAGKTTLLKILLGIIRPNRGTATILSQSHWQQSVRRKIGYLPEHFHVARHHTAISSLYFLGRLSRMSESAIKSRIPPLIELVGLKGRETGLVRTYSKGMKQRLGLAQALLHEPEILFLDEPTDGLDPVGRHHIRQCIERLRDEGKTIFVNSHILQEVEMLCDKFAIMVHGEVAAKGTISELLSQLQHDHPPKTIIEIVGDVTDLATESAFATPGLLEIQSAIENANPLETANSTVSNDASGATIALNTNDQNLIDHLIDQLRKRHVSIINIAQSRPRLEQVFMQYVNAADKQINN